MILANGTIYPSSEQSALLDGLEESINATRMGEPLSVDTVIGAIDTLGRRMAAGEFDDLLRQFGVESLSSLGEQVRGSVKLLSREYLEYKVATELGRDFFLPRDTRPMLGLSGVKTVPLPLGTLFHISAGNVDFLPAYTVVEGLLTGNINLLKLPQADNGLTLLALRTLVEIEPRLADFIYVFDTPSDDIAAMKKMAELADGIVVWGGDAAIRAARSLAAPGAKLIEWGHRLSFAYLSGNWRGQPEELTALADHLIRTEQLLCSSCQTIYIDTDSMEEIYDFCRIFLPYLQETRDGRPITEIGAAAEMTLKDYNDELERILSGDSSVGENRAFRGRNCGLFAREDSELELSELYGRCLVKRLPRDRMMTVLRRQKGYLQTAGLLCDAEDDAILSERLLRCGVNRVTSLGNMSDNFAGESHDGEYSLRRYIRMANVEMRG